VCLSDVSVGWVTEQVWLGYHQSLQSTQSGLTINVDTAATAFLEEKCVLDFLVIVLRLRGPKDLAFMSADRKWKANRAMIGKKVTSHLFCTMSSVQALRCASYLLKTLGCLCASLL
jgi:hypothetical protein